MMRFAVARPELNDSFQFKSTRFAQSWLAASHASRSVRRRLTAILRMACRTLGLKRGRGLGMLGIGGRVAVVAVTACMLAATAPDALAGNGIWINDSTDGACTFIRDDSLSANELITNKTSVYCNPAGATAFEGGKNVTSKPKNTQTERVLFYGSGAADSLSLGNELYVNGGFIGLNDQTNQAMRIGNGTTLANGKNSMAFGNSALSYGDAAIAIGNNAQSGHSLDAAGYFNGTIAIGNAATSLEADSIALGNNASTVDGRYGAVALGAKTKVDVAAGVALGTYSTLVAADLKSTAGATINGKLYSFAGATAHSAVSLGHKDHQRTILNLAAGQVSTTSTDAVNGSQLNATNTELGLVGSQVTKSQADITTINTTIGNISLKVGLTQQSAPGANLTVGVATNGAAIDLTGTAGPRKILGLAAGKIAKDSTEGVDGGQIFETNSAIASALGGGAMLDANGKIVGPTFTIRGVGQTSVGGALSALDGQLTRNTADMTAIAGDTTQTFVDTNGRGIRYARTNEKSLTVSDAFALGAGSTAIGYGASAVAVNSIAIGNNARTTLPLDLSPPTSAIAIGDGARSTASGAIALGKGATAFSGSNDSIVIGTGAGAIQPNSVAIGSNSSTAAIEFSAVSAEINGTTYNFAGKVDSVMSIGNNTFKRLITNVAAGKLNADSTDGVNGSQLFATNSALGKLGDRVTTINTTVNKGGLTQQSAPGANLTVGAATDGAAVDLTGTKGARKIFGLAAGKIAKDSTEGVDGGQIFETNSAIATALGGGARLDADGKIVGPTFNFRGRLRPASAGRCRRSTGRCPRTPPASPASTPRSAILPQVRLASCGNRAQPRI